MPHTTGTRLFWALPLGVLLLGLVYAFWPRPLELDLAQAYRGHFQEVLSETGRTRIGDVFVISAPIRGHAKRIEIEEGDAVIADQTVVVEIEPIEPEFLDIRSETEARALVDTAQAALELARAALREAQAEMDFAAAERTRIEALAARQTVSIRAKEDADRGFRIAEAAVATAEASVGMRESQLRAAEARLLGPSELTRSGAAECPCIPIRAPEDGTVLRVIHESAGVVLPGDPLLEIGDPGNLEVVTDFLSAEAVRIDPGMEVIIDEWGGAVDLAGRVRRVEPFGHTKVSALGIEEQRVEVVVDLTDPPDQRARLGHGFEVAVHVVLSEAADALLVPLTALFRAEDDWAVYEVVDGRVRVSSVKTGGTTANEAHILSGLQDGATVVRYPDDRVVEGLAVRPVGPVTR